VLQQLLAGPPRLRIDQADVLSCLLTRDTHCRGKVRVIAQDHAAVKGTLESICDQSNCEIDVRALLLGLDDLDQARSIGSREGDLPRREVAEVDSQTRIRAERSQIDILPKRLLRITRPTLHSGREVVHFVDRLLAQDLLAQAADI
jgi:hypothetical protein